MANYTELVTMVRDWANRDADVLSAGNIKTFINFAADEAYRNLRIAPLEYILTYDAIDDTNAGENKLAIPSDAIEFIQLRKQTDQSVYSEYDVYAAKSDVRSFYQDYVTKYNYYYYTRERNNLLVYPDFVNGNVFELYYYRRLAEADARYAVSDANFTANLLLFADTSDLLEAELAADIVNDPDLINQFVEITDADVDDVLQNGFYVGRIAANWLRDQNEKIFLFGALMEAFDFLDEVEQSGKYRAKFQNEIDKLNDEEMKRVTMGGNIQQHFSGFLI